MSKNYKQLSLVQRYQIEALVKAGIKQCVIARQLGVDPSTVSRELRRNIARGGRTRGTYVAGNAQRKTDLRHRQKPKRHVFTDQMKRQAHSWLRFEKWSPELISVMGKQTGKCPVSAEWIYQWIWKCKHGNKEADKAYKKLYLLLRHGQRRGKRGRRKDCRGIIHGRTPIGQRPDIVRLRERPGDVEVDFMIGKDHKGALLVITDRATLYTKLCKLENRSSHLVAQTIIKTLENAKNMLHTITFDNDQGFSEHQMIARALSVKTYFTRPYTSQDKGTVENRIGQIRRFFPKKTDLKSVGDREIKQVEKLLNNRPVRKFNYKNPKQVLLEKIALMS